MLISDWSSDVCSSDLLRCKLALAERLAGEIRPDIRSPDQNHHGKDQPVTQWPLLEHDQRLPRRKQNRQTDHQTASGATPETTALRKVGIAAGREKECQ